MDITDDAATAYFDCPYKAYLTMCGEEGYESDYQLMVKESRGEFAARATDKLIREFGTIGSQSGVNIPPYDLHEGPSVLIGPTVKHGPFKFRLDALMREPIRNVASGSGYVPVLFTHESVVRKNHRLFLAFAGAVLGEIQNARPVIGLIMYGDTCRRTRVNIASKYDREVSKALLDIREMATEELKPQATLSRACSLCLFQDRCVAEVTARDDLSLLRGISGKEIEGFHRKGIFTVNQLSYTFRPRRKRRRAAKSDSRHQYPLQAMAIRDQKVYVLQKPNLPNPATRVYVDLEGGSNARHVYLVGALVVQSGESRMHSFWADNDAEEVTAFEQLVNLLQSLDAPCVLHYGSYESCFFGRMMKGACAPTTCEPLDHSVNVLSAIYGSVYFPVYSNGLKEIGAFLGCSWSGPRPSGLQSLAWRKNWEQTSNASIKQKLILYNQDDCTGVLRITDPVSEALLNEGNRRAILQEHLQQNLKSGHQWGPHSRRRDVRQTAT